MISIMKYLKHLKSKLFFKLWFGIITILIFGFICSGLLYYRQLNHNMESRSQEYIFSSYKQLENSLSSLIDQYELIARNIYSSQKVNDFLNLHPLSSTINYAIFQTANDIMTDFDNTISNSVEINRLFVIALNSELISDGVRIIRDRNYLDQQTFQKVIDANGSNIWKYMLNKQTGQHELTLIKYLNFGKPGGILVVGLNEAHIYNTVEFDEDSKNSWFILDQEGIVISSNDRNILGQELPDSIAAFVDLQQDGLERLMVDGSKKYVFGNSLKGIFDILVMYDVDHLVIDNRRAILIQLILLSVILVATIFFIIIFGSIFAKRIKCIVMKMRRIQEGDKEIEITVRSHDELEYIDKSLFEMAININDLNEQMLEAVSKKNELELKFLQMQIKPHFLYNSLSSIRWLAVQLNDIEISELLENLIQFYKISLSKGNDVISINDEIELIKSYVALENLIYKDQILLDVYISDSLSNMTIGKMILQPFVENSIRHGKDLDKPLNIWVSIEEMNNMVKIFIEDDGIGISPDTADALNNYETNDKYENFGIFNTLSRLKMIYGDAELIVSSSGTGTVVDILIPYLNT